jgi:hypothetical protein
MGQLAHEPLDIIPFDGVIEEVFPALFHRAFFGWLLVHESVPYQLFHHS